MRKISANCETIRTPATISYCSLITILLYYRNPCQSPGGEMSLRQFGSLSELLTKLRADLRLAFPRYAIIISQKKII